MPFERLFTMNPAARRAMALKWFLQGFRLSGKGFHGESMDIDKHPALVSILTTEFERIYKEESNG